jgi:glutathione S-transferase
MIELYVSHLSPYSSKIMALLGYSEIPHRVVVETIVNRFSVLKRLTGKTMVPMLRNGDLALNDSTRIARLILAQIGVDEMSSPFLAWLIEDFADEWIVRWFAQARWSLPENRASMERRIGEEMFPRLLSSTGGNLAAQTIHDNLKRAGVLERIESLDRSRDRTFSILEELFSNGLYVFGGQPSVADFALYGFLWQFGNDPLGAPVVVGFPNTWRFVQRVHAWTTGSGEVSADIRSLAELRPLIGEILGTYWRVLAANEVLKPGEEVRLTLLDGTSLQVSASGWAKGCFEALKAEAATAQSTGGQYCADDPLNQAISAALADSDR